MNMADMFLEYKLQLKLDYYCVETNERAILNLELDTSNWDDETNVGDLKLVLQDLLNSPASLISINYGGKNLNDSCLPLKQLHFRDYDTLNLEFPASVDLASLKELLCNLKLFSTCISTFKKNFIEVTDASADDIKYEQGKETLRRLCLKFIPWKDLKTTARRQYFVQEGGMEDLMVIFRFSALEYKGDKTQCEQDTAVNDKLTLLNGQQKTLSILCLRLVWNFCETNRDRQLVLSNCSVQKLLYGALLIDPDKKFPYCAGGQLSTVLAFVNQEAIGCLAGLSEGSSSVQEAVARNGLLVRKLLLMLDRRGHKAIVHYSVFSSQLAANVLFNCTFNLLALKFLILKGVHYKMMRVTQRLLEDREGDLALRYFSVLFLARVRACATNELQDDGSEETIDRIIDRFLRLHQSCQIAEWQQEHDYNWTTLLPFVQLAFAGGPYCKCDDITAAGTQPAVAMETRTVECESCKGSKNCSKKSICSEKSKSKEIFQSWCCEAALYEDIEMHAMESSEGSQANPCSCLQKLNSISAVTCWPGSLSTQRLGLFSLQSILAVPESWTLLAEEGLLPYLIALSWQLRTHEKSMLQEALSHNLKAFNPPSLLIISKSLIAKRGGLHTKK